jgi:peptide methionine sulfoxide reductase MsrA
VGKDGRVCYHNFKGIADYGDLGHAEVVDMNIPTEKYKDFVNTYLSLFSNNLDRPDIGDIGSEYRSLIGLENGADNSLYPIFQSSAQAIGFKVEVGNGNDPDTLRRKTIWVMDTKKFPFHQAEVYHQYHGKNLLIN